MKEIGIKLKDAREKMGISIEEVAEDLKIKPAQIENIESGNSKAFEDIFDLKYLIRDYAKYLGLNKEDLVDEFNEYLFDFTSRISLDDIKMAKKEKKPKNIKSPYTIERKPSLTFIPFIVYSIIVILVVSIIYFVSDINNNDDFDEGTIVTNNK